MVNDAKNNKNLTMEELMKIFRKTGFFMLNLGCVYFLEYMCITCFTDRITNQINAKNPIRAIDSFLYKNAFTIFNFCYQIGVFLSRSSLSVVKIRRVEILTIL